MKKIIYSTFFLLVSTFAFGQSIELSPINDNVVITKYGGNIPVFSGRQANGSSASPTAAGTSSSLLLLTGQGYNGASFTGDRATISFRTSQNWTNSANGTNIIFSTTPNNSITMTNKMIIAHDGNVGIGNPAPTGKLHINHLASPSSPTLHLQSTGSSSSYIRSTSTAVGSEWDNHFVNSTSAASNLVYWTNSLNSTTPLILTGEGDAVVERNVSVGGFTNLGTGAPKIKMKELSGTFSSTTGSNTSIAHGLTQSKILSVQVFVNAATGNDIGENYPSWAAIGFEYSQYLSSANVIVTGRNGNDASLLGRPIRILITYKE